MDVLEPILEAARVQSPSSIKTFKQCPRKYYYQYIEKLPTKANIHTTRGNIAHDALEHFFDLDPAKIQGDPSMGLKQAMQGLLVTHWLERKDELAKHGLGQDKEMFYFEETLQMLFNWLEGFVQKLDETGLPFAEAFRKLVPAEREQEYESKRWSVKGFIDCIEKVDGKVRVMDYKTSKNQDVEDHRLQLSIYALLYHEKHGRLPDEVGIYFLKGGEEVIGVDEGVMEHAKEILRHIHSKTRSKDKDDYPLSISPLCKWSTGQCDFLDVCKKDWAPEQLIQINGWRRSGNSS